MDPWKSLSKQGGSDNIDALLRQILSDYARIQNGPISLSNLVCLDPFPQGLTDAFCRALVMTEPM